MEASQCSRKHVGELQKPNKGRFSRRKELNLSDVAGRLRKMRNEKKLFDFFILSGRKCPLGAQCSSVASKGTGVGGTEGAA